MNELSLEALTYFMKLTNLKVPCSIELSAHRIDDPTVWIYDNDVSSYVFSISQADQSRAELDEIINSERNRI